MTGDFNIRDRDWNLDYPFYSTHSDLLFDIANSFNLSFSHLVHPVSTRYADNGENSNLVIDLMLLWSNSLELDNHSIFPEQCFPLDYTSLIINIWIIEELIPDIQFMIIKNSKEEINFTSDTINCFKEIDIIHLMSKVLLENTVQVLAKKQDYLWHKYLKKSIL